MEIVSASNYQNSASSAALAASVTGISTFAAGEQSCSASKELTVVNTPVIGRKNANRVTTTAKSAGDGQTLSVLVEEYQEGKLMLKHFEEFLPLKAVRREVFEKDGSLISCETEKQDGAGRTTKVLIRGQGKSSTTRVLCGEIEARATERAILIETPRASYSYQPFEGRWSSFYKEIGLKLELKNNLLKNPDATLDGPDGIKLVFKGGRLVDLIVTQDHSSGPSVIPGINGIIIDDDCN